MERTCLCMSRLRYCGARLLWDQSFCVGSSLLRIVSVAVVVGYSYHHQQVMVTETTETE